MRSVFRFSPFRRYFHAHRILFKRVPFILADIGEGIKEVQLLQWHITPGQRIQQFDKIAEVQSDKAAVEITSRYDGVVTKIFHKINETAKVGEPLIEIEVDGEEGEEVKEMDGSFAAPSPSELRPKKTTGEASMKILPRLRKLAVDNNLSIADIKGSGPNGLIVEYDILKLIQNEHELPINPVRKAMMKTMTASLTIPHFGYCDEYNWSNVEILRKKLGTTALPIVIKALSEALNSFPMLNGHFIAEREKFQLIKEHNIGVAMDTEQGLIVPVMKAVNNLNLEGVIERLDDLQTRAKDNQLRPADFERASITISNIGGIGGIWAAPRIVPPQVCIVAIGRARKLAVHDKDDTFTAQAMCPLSWSADHRVIDGATLARFSEHLKKILASVE